jgi:hypothetical protein
MAKPWVMLREVLSATPNMQAEAAYAANADKAGAVGRPMHVSGEMATETDG